MKYILLSDSDKLDIVRLRQKGVTLREISKYIGCNISTVRYHLCVFDRNSVSCFKDAKAFEEWKERNCYKCKKSPTYSERYHRYKKCYCTVKNHLEGKDIKVEGISLRTYKAAQQTVCPYLK